MQGFKDEIGYAIGVVSSIFYIGSRSAQLYKNVSILLVIYGVNTRYKILLNQFMLPKGQ